MTNLPFISDPSGHILVASPNHAIRERLLRSLSTSSSKVEQALGGADALARLESGAWGTLLLDRRLPDLDTDELAATIRRRFPAVRVVIVDTDVPTEAEGAQPAQAPRSRAAEGNQTVTSELLEYRLPGMIGTSRAMLRVYRAARLLARRDTTVLISGPTGSGKELVARAIHSLSTRSQKPFVVVNCAAIPEALLESELFGYTRGAFTGAMQSYGGRIQAAHKGTLLLDEIGDMPLALQPKLLRFLEQKEIQRLGSCEAVRIDARVIAATNADLPSLAAEGKFREDLYYRLSAFPIIIPPLRGRRDDIVALIGHLLQTIAGPAPVPELSAQTTEILCSQAWPGNVRELQNVLERAVILAENALVIRPEHLLLNKDSLLS